MPMESRDGIVELIRAIALENAVTHRGKAIPGPVLGKLLSLKPGMRDRVKDFIPIIEEVVEEVNNLSLDEQRHLLEGFAHLLPPSGEREEEKRELPPLPGAEMGAVVTRFSPNPNFVLHLGSARAAILSHDYARMYGGKFILRFEDTDPRTKRPVMDYYEAIREDLRWLGCQWDEEYIQSQRLPLYYDVAEELLRRDAAYICECEKDLFSQYILEGKPCPDRGLNVETHLERFRRMLDGDYPPGKAILRIKTDLSHPNPAVRDWPALRMIDTERYPHPLTGSKYRVWPLYNFSCAVDDHLLGVTHIIRGVEHQVNTERQRYIYHHMGWIPSQAIHYGRLGISTGILSKSKILKGISEGLYLGYDDPRLATLASLRRRGFQPGAIRKVIYEVGLNPSPALIDWSHLEAFNKKIVDPRANRRFVVVEPYPLTIKGVPGTIHAEVRLHPDFPERGVRRFHLSPRDGKMDIYIERSDAEAYGRGSLVRLMGLFNLIVERIGEASGEAVFKDYGVSTALKAKAPIIHWVPSHPHVEVDLLWPDASRRHCLGERGLLEEGVGSIVQMERVGYARVDSIRDERVSLIFSHR